MTTTTARTVHTVTDAYLAAHAALVTAEELDTATDCTCAPDDETCAGCDARTAWIGAARACDAARAAWLASDEEREYDLRDDSATWTITSTPDEIESDAEDSLREGDWDASEGTLHLSVTVFTRDPATGDRIDDQISVSVDIEPEEPECAEGEAHDWCAPYSVLGGLRENPGVWGHGAGIQTRRVCSHCGAYQLYESACQDSGTGRYYEATSYEEADEYSLAWVARRAAQPT